MASYDWSKSEKPEDYEQLLGLLDGEFEPRRIVKKLKAKITRPPLLRVHRVETDDKGNLGEVGAIA